MRCSGVLCNHGFSLIELLIVIVVVGILTSIAMQSMDVAIDNARRNRTEQEMEMLADAIVGDPSQMQSSVRCDFGYVGDVGAFPSNLQALYRNPGGYATWDGPYVRSGFSEDSTGFKTDEWGTLYSYSGGAEISSTGSGSTITKKIADATNDYLLNTLRGTIKDAGNEPPGFVYADSIDIVVSIPDGSGSTANKTYKPDASGVFTLDSLPAGQHPLRIIYEPTVDTLFRYVTILPRHKSRPAYRFATAYFSDTSGSEMSSALTLSATNSATLGGLVFANEDLIKYDPDADTASMLFDGSTAFSANEDVDAVCLLANGHIVLSTAGSATIGSLSFFNEDLVNYDPSTGTATMFFDGGTVFSDNEDIDAVHILENGHVVLSTAGPATIGSLSFEERDLVNYDPAADTATVLFDGSEVFADEADVNAAHILDNGHIIISTNANESIGSLSFGNEDLVEYDPAAGTAGMYFDGDVPFGTSAENINAVHLGSSPVTFGILRPTGAGSTTELTATGCPANWQCVADSAGYVRSSGSSFSRDEYETEDPSEMSGTISSVTVFFVARRMGSPASGGVVLRTHSTLYTPSPETLANSFTTYSYKWTANPHTGGNWTWTEVADMQIGIRLRRDNPGGNNPRCARVWAVAAYSN